MKIEPMQAKDYDRVMALWKGTEGVGLSDADSRERICTAFLSREQTLAMSEPTPRASASTVGEIPVYKARVFFGLF